MREHGICKSDYYLYGAGRALGFVRMAAAALEEPGGSEVAHIGQKESEYHAYAGISSARTAIDAVAVWLNVVLHLDVKQGPGINLSRKDFRDIALVNLPEPSKEYVEHLGELGREIDEHRQRAQHREGLAVSYYSSQQLNFLSGWYLRPKGDK